MDETLSRFLELLEEKLTNEKLVKLTLSKPRRKSDDLRNVYVKPVQLKAGRFFSFDFKFETRHEVKNFDADQAKEQVQQLLETHFLQADLFGLEADSSLTIFSSGKMKLKTRKIAKREAPDMQHDRQKKRLLNPTEVWWFQLGLTDREGNILPSMQHKFKQINRYTEILSGLFKSTQLTDKMRVVDMGSGKGYLTFALYEYLQNQLNLMPLITGVEMREDLVEKTNAIARHSGLEGLNFALGSIG